MNAKSIIYLVLSSISVVPNGNATLAKKKAKIEKKLLLRHIQSWKPSIDVRSDVAMVGTTDRE